MNKPRVLVTQFVHEAGLQLIRDACDAVIYADERPLSPDALTRELPTVEGVLCHPFVRFDAATIALAPKLRVISDIAAGYDNIDVAAATARGIAVCNTPGAVEETTADHTFALLLSLARRIPEAEQYVRQQRWRYWSPKMLLGTDVHGKTLGIIGFGTIGRAVAERARGFRMRILVHSRTPRPELEAQLGVTHVDLPTLLRESDFVTLHLPLTPATRHRIGAEQLALMKPTAFLVNAARGAVVDQRALTAALAERRIAGAALDVFETEPIAPDDPLLGLDNVVVAPHIGGASVEARDRMARMAAENLIAVLEGRRPAAIVNPEVLVR